MSNYIYSDSSSLLANSAKASLLLVRHSSKVQEAAANFARNLDLAYKIWSDLIAFKKDCNHAINKTETIVNAIYKDKYDDDDHDQVQTSQGVVIESEKRSSTNSQRSMASSFLSGLFSSSSSSSSTASTQLVDELLYDRIYADCKSLFDDHYRLAIDSLDRLENEHSERDAVASLRSMLNVMQSTVR